MTARRDRSARPLAGWQAVVPAAVGLVVDRMLGEPPAPIHPVAGLGSAAGRLERITYRPSRLAGAIHSALVVGAAAAAGVTAERLVGRRFAAAAAAAVTIAHRMLVDEVEDVASALALDDLPTARAELAQIVGRDVTGLDADEIARAAVETLAENTVDAVVATVFWTTIGGAPAALAHRSINTLDAMIGHRTDRYERFGWAAARTDDVVNYVPARLTVLSVLLARPRRARNVVRAVRRDAPQHPSPNGGVVEAAFAAALDVQLGGSNRYGERTEHRGVLGDGDPPRATDIHRAVTLSRQVAVVSVATLAVTSTVLVSGAIVSGAALVRRRVRPVRR